MTPTIARLIGAMICVPMVQAPVIGCTGRTPIDFRFTIHGDDPLAIHLRDALQRCALFPHRVDLWTCTERVPYDDPLLPESCKLAAKNAVFVLFPACESMGSLRVSTDADHAEAETFVACHFEVVATPFMAASGEEVCVQREVNSLARCKEDLRALTKAGSVVVHGS